MKRTLKNSSLSHKALQHSYLNKEGKTNELKDSLKSDNKYQAFTHNSGDLCQMNSEKTTCSFISYFIPKHSDKEPSAPINKQNVNTCIHRLKYKSLDNSSYVCVLNKKKYGQTNKPNSYISKSQIQKNALNFQSYVNLHKFNDPQKNETSAIQLIKASIQQRQQRKHENIQILQCQNQKTIQDQIKISERLFSSYNICQQKSKLYREIAQARNRKYSYGNQSVIERHHFLSKNLQRQLSFGQNKNSVYSTIHSTSGQLKQINQKQAKCIQSLRNRGWYQSIDFYIQKEKTLNQQNLGFTRHKEIQANTNKNSIQQSIIHKLDDFMLDPKAHKIDHNKQFIRKSRKNIEILPETDTNIQKKKENFHQNMQIDENTNKKDKINSKESIQPVNRRARLTSLDECGYTIVSKYNKSQDKKSIMQESNIVFQASKHVMQQQSDNQVSSNFQERNQSEVLKKRNCQSFINKQVNFNQQIQPINFVRQKARNNFIREKRKSLNKNQGFQLLDNYIKDEQLSIRFDLNLNYQNECNSQL